MALRVVGPVPSSDDVADLHLGDAVFSAESRVGDTASRVSFTNRDHVCFCDLRSPVALSAWSTLGVGVGARAFTTRPSFRVRVLPVPSSGRRIQPSPDDLVSAVVGICSDIEMAGSHAHRDVAMVEHQQPFRYWAAVFQFPRDSMCPEVLLANAENSVAVCRRCIQPEPAVAQPGPWFWTCLVHLRPEAIGKRSAVEASHLPGIGARSVS